jgi:AAA family ATP:ADP antiporter
MAYIPLDAETQTKGKAAIDVVCNPLGKSGGSLIQQVMIIAFGSLAASTPYLGVILMGIVIIWILAANSLSKQFTEANKADQLAKLSEARAAQVGAPLQKFKFVSALNEQGFIEGKYVPVGANEDVTASMDIIEADSAEAAAALAAEAESRAKTA